MSYFIILHFSNALSYRPAVVALLKYFYCYIEEFKTTADPRMKIVPTSTALTNVL